MSWKFRESQAAELDGVDIVGLVGEVLVLALRLDLHAHVAVLWAGLDLSHRGGEVDHVQRLGLTGCQLGVFEVEHHVVAALAHVDGDAGVGKVYLDAPLAAGASSEVNQLDAAPVEVRGGASARVPDHGGAGRPGRRPAARAQDGGLVDAERDDDGAVAGLDPVGYRGAEVDHHPRAVARLDGGHAARDAYADGLRLGLQAAAGVGKIDGDPRRVVGREAADLIDRLGGLEHDVDPVAGKGREGDVLQSIALGQHRLAQQHQHQRSQQCSCRLV